jgi:hypothetical protein
VSVAGVFPAVLGPDTHILYQMPLTPPKQAAALDFCQRRPVLALARTRYKKQLYTSIMKYLYRTRKYSINSPSITCPESSYSFGGKVRRKKTKLSVDVREQPPVTVPSR